MSPETGPEIAGDSLRSFMQLIRRRWALIALCVIIAPAAAFGYTLTQKKQYQATATILVGDPSQASALAGAGSSSASSAFSANLLVTDTAISSLDVIARDTAARLHRLLGGKGLPGTVTTNNDGSSNLITVTATAGSPSVAAAVANTYAHQYIDFQTRTNVAHIKTQEADLVAKLHALGGSAASGAEAATLTSQIAQLSTLASLQNSNLQVIDPATPPTSPSSPKTTRIVAAGAGLGLAVGILLAVLFAALDRRLWSTAEVEKLLDGPILGAIPQSRSVAAGRQLTGPELESFAKVYANMRHFNRRKVRSILVTSAAGGEGKSTVAWNLATAASAAGAKVLLIEADLRKPVIAARLGTEPSAGLVDVLSGDVTLTDVVESIPLASHGTSGEHHNGHDGENHNGHAGEHHNGHNGNGLRPSNLGVLFARPTVSSESESRLPLALLASDDMRNLIMAAERVYDLVVIDTPPTSAVSDAVPLFRHVGGVLIVTRVRANTRGGAIHLRDQLHNLGANVLGVVVNGVDRTDEYCATSYGYFQ